MANIKDLTGKKYFRLTVVGLSKDRGCDNKILWDCVCKCGNNTTVLGSNLSAGRVKSCGCFEIESRLKRKINLVGKAFGRLSVISEKGRSKDGNVMWLCRCDCGKEITTNGRNLKRGDTNSCGCVRSEYYSSARKHGHSFKASKTSEYRTWGAMKSRCLNPKNKYYYNYGGRGIKICSRWLGNKGFEHFLSDMGPKTSDKHSLDRIKNNKNYTPKNCRWATKYEQERNKRSNIWFTYNGERRILKDWARILGINYGTLRGRVGCGKSFNVTVNRMYKNKVK